VALEHITPLPPKYNKLVDRVGHPLYLPIRNFNNPEIRLADKESQAQDFILGDRLRTS
jgi:hypothetical protein